MGWGWGLGRESPAVRWVYLVHQVELPTFLPSLCCTPSGEPVYQKMHFPGAREKLTHAGSLQINSIRWLTLEHSQFSGDRLPELELGREGVSAPQEPPLEETCHRLFLARRRRRCPAAWRTVWCAGCVCFQGERRGVHVWLLRSCRDQACRFPVS